MPLELGEDKAVGPSWSRGTVPTEVVELVEEAFRDSRVPPEGRTLRMDWVVEEATLKIVLEEPAVPWTLKLTVEEVALIPATVPLLKIVLVARAVGEVK